MEYKKYRCPKCQINYASSQYTEGDKPTCDTCSTPLTITEETDPEAIIRIADEMLESANYHSLQANKCWDEIKEFIPEEKRLEAAKALAGWFNNIC